ncbi:ABC transporter substrate-binding protein [Tomitella fengzijianii]|uniref:ABC transporter substrate-binding protein n=1 Tax=Tomitella fengzijianii TaxID=2597660 RepID=A0A516X6W2_9ACTN|nr:ABC transporter substrate-binding protein [Tomitella fengzijianii]QDQ98808.1 ABC transporter substrate-binding protein [Tomitella fengzijianii]
MKLTRPRLGRVVIAAAACAALLAGCADAGAGDDVGTASSSEVSQTRGFLGEQGEPGEPVQGGTVTFASYAPVATLDPALTPPTGPTGGTEMAAVYDVLVQYDDESESFVPRLAESLEESDDHMTWTLTLRDGVTFSDGTPLNADAVVSSIKRFNDGAGLYSELYLEMVESTTAKDPSTVVFTLTRPWRDFPAILAYGHGMIVAPSSDKGGKFTPIGAGPFTVARLQPQQTLELTARPDYWGGKPNLDGLKFVAISGDQAKIDSLKTGGVDMIYLRGADTVNAAKAQFPGFIETASMSLVGLINVREGRPGADPRVRQAMAYAIDPEVINQRGYDGQNMAGTDMFEPWSKWHGDASGIEPDPAKAKELLDQAKADGYDGRLTYVGINSPERTKVALAIQAQLNAVGFDVTLDYASSVTDMVMRVNVDRDFDLALGAYEVTDVAPEIRLFNSLAGKSDPITGANDPEMNQLISDMLSAPDEAAKQAAIDGIQKAVNEQQPFMTWSAGQTYIAWADDVFGVDPSVDQIMLLDKAFIGK